MGSLQSKQQAECRTTSSSIARGLPTEILLDSLAHLPPVEVDRSIRFVCRSFNALVEKYGVSDLPKHSLTIHIGEINVFTYFFSWVPREIAVEWHVHGSKEVEKIKEESLVQKQQPPSTIPLDALQKVLRSRRLGRIPLLTICVQVLRNWQNRSLMGILCEERLGERVATTVVKVIWDYDEHCHRVVQALRPACLKTRCCLVDLPHLGKTMRCSLGPLSHTEKTTRHFVHHLIGYQAIEMEDIAEHVLEGPANRRFVFEVYYCDLSDYLELVTIITRRLRHHRHFPLDMLILYDKPDERVAPYDVDIWEWEETLGEAYASQRLVNKMVEVDIPGHDYYRRLERCKWNVWRLPVTHDLHAHAGDAGLVAGGEYLQVMLKVGGNAKIPLAIYFKMVCYNSRVVDYSYRAPYRRLRPHGKKFIPTKRWHSIAEEYKSMC